MLVKWWNAGIPSIFIGKHKGNAGKMLVKMLVKIMENAGTNTGKNTGKMLVKCS